MVKNLPAKTGASVDSGSIPGLGGSPGVGNGNPFQWAFLVAQMVKNLPAVQETWVPSLGGEDALEMGMANPL